MHVSCSTEGLDRLCNTADVVITICSLQYSKVEREYLLAWQTEIFAPSCYNCLHIICVMRLWIHHYNARVFVYDQMFTFIVTNLPIVVFGEVIQ